MSEISEKHEGKKKRKEKKKKKTKREERIDFALQEMRQGCLYNPTEVKNLNNNDGYVSRLIKL
jgi:hypothetical protein